MKVVVTAEARARIEAEIAAAGNKETGGVLLGWRRPDLDVVVVAAATGPGKHAVQRRNLLELDTADLQNEIDNAFDATGGDHAFLGDWHLHHEPKPQPSGRDLASLNELTAEASLAMDDGLLVVVGRNHKGALAWRCWGSEPWSEVALDLV